MWTSYQPKKSITLERFFSVFEATYDSTYFFQGEAHDFWEVVTVLEGDVCVSAGKNIFHLSKGEMIFHKPMEFHKFHIENGKSATLFVMSFAASGELMGGFEKSVLHLSPEQRQMLTSILSYLRQECELPNQCNFACLDELERHPSKFQGFTCMTELLLLSLAKENVPIRADFDTPETIAYRKAVQTMEKNVGAWLSVSEIARECHVSVSYLKNIFRKYAGLGIHQYYLKTKMIHASNMLRTGKSVSETAEQLAFSSPNYFSTVYKRETGLTPLEYKVKS